MNVKKSRAGFTLIELLIVVAIFTVFSASAMTFYTRLREAEDYNIEKMNAMEDEQKILRVWREDIALAQRMEISPDAAMLSVFRGAPETEVRYACANARLTRNVGTTSQTLLSTNVDGLHFEKNGRAIRIGWNSVYNDGVRKTTTAHSAIGTPLVWGKESIQ